MICPDKVSTEQWLAVHDAAHRVGLRSNVTIMFGHVERPEHWARHLLRAREQQERSGGFTEFVPLPFVHMEAPMWLKGRARSGPTFGESLLLHAVARLALHPAITNIQASWVKLGPDGVAAALRAGVNDLGGTLMNESISRSAGSEHGQEMPPEAMEALIRANGRTPRQRTTLYGDAPAEQRAASFAAPAAGRAAEPSGPRRRPEGAAAPRPAGPARPRALVALADHSRQAEQPARDPPSACPQRALEGSRVVMDPLAVAHEQMVGLETPERARRPEPQHGVEAGGLCPGPEEGDRPERVRDEQEPPLRPPERHLAPPAEPDDRAQLERRPGKLAGHDVMRDAEPPGDGGAVAVVPVEQLDDARRLAELADPVVEPGPVDDVEEPDAAVDLERVRRARHPLLRHPAGDVRDLVDGPHARSSCANACSKTSSGCAPRTSRRRSSTKAGTAFAPIEYASRVEASTRSR